ncbi:integral membrane protein Pth11-like protein [Aspergillus taichungensis]|uniref:Integral membrane protein Pth11-like protein n=1 Tax=Aspergillus taichungensis TaxID=482145 RepID=A0A2J5HX92_9EURO|nr:integral membrane protein Pth11-like protein [Aspergillus taichungensis]
MATSNEYGPDSKGSVVIGVALAFAIITFVVIVLRLFARIYVLRQMGFDDYLIIGACLFSWAFSAVTIVAVRHGLGSHMASVPLAGMETYAFAVWLSSMFYLAAIGFIKTSVCWFYTRLGARYLTRLAYIMMVIVACQATSFVLVAAFQCNPIPKAWKGTAIPGKCVTINVFYLANAALNILTDVLTYTLPIKVVFELQMPKKQKMVLGLILSLGLLACISSIIRITYIPGMLTSKDATYAITGAMYWSVIEINIGILAASIPSFKAIASRFLPRLIGEYTSNRKYATFSDDPRKYGTGFSRVQDDGMALGGVGKSYNDTAMGTQIGRTTSEDRIFVPEGRIYAKTQIETNVEDSREYSGRSSSLERH